MKRSVALFFLFESAAVVYGATGASRPRGVGPEFAQHYADSSSFTCISNPSIKIPFARVNDDYCDCPDGSDEPGTSACAHLSSLSPRTPADSKPGAANTTLALPGFYCENQGHNPSYVPFSNVNDGICDYDLCCDGSEEWGGVGKVKCENRCKETGKEWRKLEDARQKALGKATAKRRELVTVAARKKKEVEDRIKTLQTQVQAAELSVKELEQDLKDIEEKERGKMVKAKAGGEGGGKMGVLVGLAQGRTEELREYLTKVRRERDDYFTRLEELESLLTRFKEDYNPNFNDEGVKRAVRAWEDYSARDHEFTWEAEAEKDLNAILQSDEDNGVDWTQFMGEEEKDTDVLYAFENYLPPTIRAWLDQKLRELRVSLISAGILADNASSESGGAESSAVTDARYQRDNAVRSLEQLKQDIEEHKEDLAKDFGPDDIFRALEGECVSTDSGEYTYELCFWDKTTQRSKKGGASTDMGVFVRLETMVVDEPLPADGKGLGSGVRLVMRHENGQHCWNGPNRSTAVILACAEENEVWRIMEEEKCVYRMEVGTPAACEAPAAKPADAGKDEL